MLSQTPTMPNTAAPSSMQLEWWATSQPQSVITSARQFSQVLFACLPDAIGRCVDRRQCLGRRTTDLDVGHGMDRRDVVVRPGMQNVLLGSAITAGASAAR